MTKRKSPGAPAARAARAVKKPSSGAKPTKKAKQKKPRTEIVSASFAVRRGEGARVGMERIALLEAVDALGSISAAARALGLSYKSAWDAVQALNNLFPAPLIEAAAGGKSGGAARVTQNGRAVATAFRRVQSEIDAAMGRLDHSTAFSFWSMSMRTSARNALRGSIAEIATGSVNSEVKLKVADDVVITAIVTRQSIEELDIEVGKPAIALIKAGFVMLAKGDARTSARNQIKGKVVSREDGAVNSEIALDIGGGKTIVSSITIESAIELDIKIGEEITALIKAPHVILAVD